MALDLALAKLQLRVTHSAEDTLISQYMAAAATTVEQRSGTLLTRREVTQRFASFSPRLPLYWGPDPANVTVAYVDDDGTDLDFDDAQIVRDWLHAPTTGWPWIATGSVIEVTYTAGWTTVPADLVNAQLLLIQIAYQRRLPSGDEDRAINDLIENYRRVLV